MHRSNASRVFAATLAMLAMSLGSACKRAEPPAPPPPEVLVTTVVQKDVPIQAEAVGTTVGFVNAQVMPRVQGYLLKQDYQDGANVKAGQLLFEIDDRPYKAALDQALGDLAQEQATLRKNQLDVARYTPLVREGGGEQAGARQRRPGDPRERGPGAGSPGGRRERPAQPGLDSRSTHRSTASPGSHRSRSAIS